MSLNGSKLSFITTFRYSNFEITDDPINELKLSDNGLAFIQISTFSEISIKLQKIVTGRNMYRLNDKLGI